MKNLPVPHKKCKCVPVPSKKIGIKMKQWKFKMMKHPEKKKFKLYYSQDYKDKCQKEIQKIKEKLIGAKILKNILKIHES